MFRLLTGIVLGATLAACATLPQHSETYPQEYPPYPPADVGYDLNAIFSEPYFGEPAPARLSILGLEQTSGVGIYSWYKDENTIVHADAFAVVAPSHPLTVTVPFTATLILPVPLTPESLEAVLYPVTGADLWGAPRANPALREFEHWNPPALYAAQSLPLFEQQDLYFESVPESHYILHVRAEWADLGSVYYGFYLFVKNPEEKWDPQSTPANIYAYPPPALRPILMPTTSAYPPAIETPSPCSGIMLNELALTNTDVPYSSDPLMNFFIPSRLAYQDHSEDLLDLCTIDCVKRVWADTDEHRAFVIVMYQTRSQQEAEKKVAEVLINQVGDNIKLGTVSLPELPRHSWIATQTRQPNKHGDLMGFYTSFGNTVITFSEQMQSDLQIGDLMLEDYLLTLQRLALIQLDKLRAADCK